MPTIAQLPAATSVSATDELPISQNGTVASVTVSQLLASTQPAITLPGTGLLGQPNPGPGAPVPVAIGQGVTIVNGSLEADGLDHLSFPEQESLSLADEVIVNADGTPSRLPITQLFSLYSAGENITIDSNGTISAQGGPTGPAGPPGASLLIGDGAPSGTLGAAGDTYIDAAAGTLYVHSAGTWAPVGNITGPAGPAGPVGSAGPVGATGPAGSKGPMGPMGPAGAVGPAGPAGVAGTAFLAGSGAPSATLGADGDTYLDTHAGNLYICNDGSWKESANIVGPAGPAGAAGSNVTISNLPVVASIGSSDLVGISQSGTDHAITYANFLAGETIDELAAADAVADSDSMLVGQGGSTVLRQTFAAVWSWISAKLPTYSLPVVELTANTTLSGVQHNGRLLVCSAPVTVTANLAGMGSGFVCDLLNVASGPVALSGMTTSSGVPSIAAGQSARVYVATYSGGTLAYAALSAVSSGNTSAVPGQVAGVSITAATGNSVTLSWGVPAGPLPTSYVVQYRVSGTTAWSTQAASSTVSTIANLLALTSYDVTVAAANAAGQGTSSSIIRATTSAAQAPVPSAVTGLSIATPTASAIALTWTAPSGASAQTVQFRVTGTSAWTTASSTLSATATTYTVTGLAASTTYDVQVFGTNASGAGPAEMASGISTSASGSSGSGTGGSGSGSGSGTGGSGSGSGSGTGGSGSGSGSGTGGSGSGSGGSGGGSPPGPLTFTYVAGSGTGAVANETIAVFSGATNMQTPMTHGSAVASSVTWQQISSVANVVWWFDTSPNNTSKTASTVASGTVNTFAGMNSGAVFFYDGNAPAAAGTYYGKMAFYDGSNTLLGVFATQAITVT